MTKHQFIPLADNPMDKSGELSRDYVCVYCGLRIDGDIPIKRLCEMNIDEAYCAKSKEEAMAREILSGRFNCLKDGYGDGVLAY